MDAKDIKNNVFQMGDLKAPGPGGILALFFQKYWDIVGPDIIAAVKHFFDHGFLLTEWNSTFICLIPKVVKTEEPSHFRPIILCNVIYKVISKVLVHKLKPIIHKLVSPIKNAFIPGQLLSNKCLITHELVNMIKKRIRRGEFLVGFKIDMYKAYDMVNWHFLGWLLDTMNFPTKFRHWIM